MEDKQHEAIRKVAANICVGPIGQQLRDAVEKQREREEFLAIFPAEVREAADATGIPIHIIMQLYRPAEWDNLTDRLAFHMLPRWRQRLVMIWRRLLGKPAL